MTAYLLKSQVGLFYNKNYEIVNAKWMRDDRRTKKDLRTLNNEAGQFFCHRGLQVLFGSKVHWNVGKLFEFDKLDKEWRAEKKSFVNRSVAKTALKLKFFLELECTVIQ